MESEVRLAVILYADIVGYSRLMEQDESGTLEAVRQSMERFTAMITEHRGVKIKEGGDSILAEFGSARSAVQAALDFQRAMVEKNPGADSGLIEFRVGINLGEIHHRSGDVFGAGVNVAARIQGFCEPGGLAISASVNEQVRGNLDIEFFDCGFHKLKNISQPVHVFAIDKSSLDPAAHPAAFLTSSRVKGQPLFDLDGGAMTKSFLATGGCLCGKVRFEINEPEIGTGYCHCSICRKSVGAVVNAWAAFHKSAVRFTNQEPKYYYTSPIAVRGFCAECGTSLTYHLEKPDSSDFLVICVGAMDEPENFPPVWHGGIESRIPWFNIHDELPRMESRESPSLQKAWESVGVVDPDQWGPGIFHKK